jgi:hypothetical protein
VRAVADDVLAPGQREGEERFQVLFQRHPADVQRDRPVLCGAGPRPRVKQRQVHPAGPAADSPPEPLGPEFPLQGRRCDHDRPCRPVKPLHVAVTPLKRQGQHLVQVFRELGMVRSGEVPTPLAAVAANRQPDRPLRGDVNVVRLKGVDGVVHLPGVRERELDLRVKRHRHADELSRLDDPDLVPRFAQHPDGRGECADDAVDLGLPGVGGKQDATAGGEPAVRPARSEKAEQPSEHVWTQKSAACAS